MAIERLDATYKYFSLIKPVLLMHESVLMAIKTSGNYSEKLKCK